MKLRNIFISILACLAIVSCDKGVEFKTLAELQVSNSYISINKDGGSTSITLTATDNWAFDQTKIPTWLTVSPVSGSAGDYTVTFSAEGTSKTRKASDLAINVAGKVQLINVEQSIGITPVSNATCAEVIAGADGKTYRVSGTVTSIVNTVYGNWYLTDATGQIYIYGTLDKNGAEQKFTSLGLEVGDNVVIEGPKTTYNGVVELVNVTVISITKSLISAVDKEVKAPQAGGISDIKLICKGNGVNFNIPEDASSYLSVKAITPGVGDTTIVSLLVAPNEAGARATTLEFTTTSGGTVYSTKVDFSQDGSILDATVAEFIAAPVSTSIYRVGGKITSIYSADKGRFYIAFDTDTLYVYGLAQSMATEKLKVGDFVTLLGQRGQYKDVIEMLNASLENKSIEVTVAEFLAAPIASSKINDQYYKLTGVVANINTSNNYGNFDLVDATGSIYVYGLRDNPVRKSLKIFDTFGIHEGDTLTIVAQRGAYGSTQEAMYGYYVSHTPAAN